MKKFETTLVALTIIFTAMYFFLLDHMLEQHITYVTSTIVLLSSLMYLAWMISVIIVALSEEAKDTLL